MQMVKKILLIITVILLSLIIFAPKRELYYLLENRLSQQDIVIDNEEIEGGLFSLKLEHPVIYVKGIKVAQVDEVELFTLILYSSVSGSQIKIDDSLRSLAPELIDSVDIYYHILNPGKIRIKAEGSFGKAEGYILISEGLLHMDLTEEKEAADKLRPMLKKGEKGWYYEVSF